MGAFQEDIWFRQSYELSTVDDVFTFVGTILKVSITTELVVVSCLTLCGVQVMSSVGPYERCQGWADHARAAQGIPPGYDQHPNLPECDPIWSLLSRMWKTQNPSQRPSMEIVVQEASVPPKAKVKPNSSSAASN